MVSRTHFTARPFGVAAAVGIVLCGTVGASGPAFAQAAQQLIDEGLRRQEERSREQQRTLQPGAEVLTPARPAAGKSQFPQESDCFVVNELQFAGPDAAHFAWLVDAAMPYLRRCVGPKGLAFIASELDASLRARGFITSRVALPPQNLQGGKLEIHVQAGRAQEIRLVRADGSPNASTADEAWGTWRNAFPIAAGDIVNVRDLEQGVENMRRVPSQSVTTRLEPGDTPGASIVYVERKAGGVSDRIRGGITLDNSGSAVLGRAQLAAHVAFDNPAGLNDVITASLNTNAQQPSDTHHSQSASLQYSVPWGYNLLTLSATNSRFAQHVQGTTVRFLSSGRSSTAEARLQRTMWRSSSARLGLYGSVSTRRAVSYLDDVEVVVQRRRTTNAEVGAQYRQLFERSSIDLQVGYRQGVSWHAQDDFDSSTQGGLTLRPKLWSLNAAYLLDTTIAGRPVQFSSQLRGQFTKNTTLSVDQMSIGGRGSVRGFDGDAVLLAENGVVLRNEVTTPLALLDGVDTAALFAIDYGRVWGPSDIQLAGNRLAGVALGVRGRWRATHFDLTLAAPLTHPDGFSSRRLSVYASITQSF